MHLLLRTLILFSEEGDSSGTFTGKYSLTCIQINEQNFFSFYISSKYNMKECRFYEFLLFSSIIVSSKMNFCKLLLDSVLFIYFH